MTETESDQCSSDQISLKKRSPLHPKEEKPKSNHLKMIFRTLFWLVGAQLVLVGHFYCAMFMIWSASYFYSEFLTMSRVLQKDLQIKLNWLDSYWYAVGFYVCIPYAFNRNKIFTIESKTIQFFLY